MTDILRRSLAPITQERGRESTFMRLERYSFGTSSSRGKTLTETKRTSALKQ
jgi:hypothetical protein